MVARHSSIRVHVVLTLSQNAGA